MPNTLHPFFCATIASQISPIPFPYKVILQFHVPERYRFKTNMRPDSCFLTFEWMRYSALTTKLDVRLLNKKL